MFSELLHLYVEKGNEYIIQHMTKIRESILQGKSARVMETQNRSLRIDWEKERGFCGLEKKTAVKTYELCTLQCSRCLHGFSIERYSSHCIRWFTQKHLPKQPSLRWRHEHSHTPARCSIEHSLRGTWSIDHAKFLLFSFTVRLSIDYVGFVRWLRVFDFEFSSYPRSEKLFGSLLLSNNCGNIKKKPLS